MEMLALSPYKKLSEYVRSKRKEFGEIYYDRIDHPYHAADRNDKLPLLANHSPASITSFTVVRYGGILQQPRHRERIEILVGRESAVASAPFIGDGTAHPDLCRGRISG
jgi:hypothetical protein